MGNMSKEKIEDPKNTENVSVDVIEYAHAKEKEVVAKLDPDATEYSSSFADTTSGNGNSSELSDAEVESQFFGDIDVMPPFGLNSIFPMRCGVFRLSVLSSAYLFFLVVYKKNTI